MTCILIGSMQCTTSWILTRNGSILRFKDRNSANQKLTDKKLISDRNCCPCSLQRILPTVLPCPSICQQCFLVQATARPKPSCHGEKLLSLQIAGFSHTYPRPKKKKLPSIANSRTAPGSSVHLPEISWNKIWKLWLWLLTFCLWIRYLNAVSELE